MMTSRKSVRVCARIRFTIMVLLLYEGVADVVAVPVGVSGGTASQSSSSLQNSNNVKLLSMPIWARKAGGNWRPELAQVQEISKDVSTGNLDPSYSPGESENTPEEEDFDLEVRKRVDAEGNRADKSRTHQLREQQSHARQEVSLESEITKSSTEGESKQENDDYEYEYDELHPEEKECPDTEFFHARSHKCVPFECPGGNAWRDRHTGDCILKYYGRNRWRSRPWRP